MQNMLKIKSLEAKEKQSGEDEWGERELQTKCMLHIIKSS